MLFDRSTNRITALLDYDFGHVSSQADEYFYSLSCVHGLVVPPFWPEEDIDAMRNYLIHGWDEKVIEKTSEAVDWSLAVMLDQELSKVGVQRPMEIGGIEELSALYWFIQDISPPMFFLKRWRAVVPPEKVEEIREDTRGNLERYLEYWGC